VGIVWDALRESSANPAQRIASAIGMIILAVVLGYVCAWACEGLYHVATEAAERTTGSRGRRAERRGVGVLAGIALITGFGTVGLGFFGIAMLVIPGKRPEA